MSNLSDYKKAAQELADTQHNKVTALDEILRNLYNIGRHEESGGLTDRESVFNEAKQALLDWHQQEIAKAKEAEHDIQVRMRLYGKLYTKTDLANALREAKVHELTKLVTNMDSIGRLTNYAKIKAHVLARIGTLKEHKD